MRTCFAFFLGMLLSLNAATAAVAAICDALEPLPSHGVHFGHHSHDHDDDHDHGASPAVPDDPHKSQGAENHHHVHVHPHPGFSTLLPGVHDMAAPEGHSPMIAGTSEHYASAPHLRLDRPPRAVLA
ncbi:MAG: hypothetical protein MUP61_06095 [Burkholderiales bacterium]|nr:hypothetical protein [Burkholderiales bacterium]MCJ7838768.1 hypothetical protein [Burkholderiales bacterium]